MWARVTEAMLGFWLLMSPFIFSHPQDAVSLWTVDLSAGLTVIVLASLCYWRPTHAAHFVTMAVAAVLVAIGYFSENYPASPGLQNEMITGLVLLMLSIVPNYAFQPSTRWQDFQQPEFQQPES